MDREGGDCGIKAKECGGAIGSACDVKSRPALKMLTMVFAVFVAPIELQVVTIKIDRKAGHVAKVNGADIPQLAMAREKDCEICFAAEG